jgi:NAD(P)H-nitrite reductase large subunit
MRRAEFKYHADRIAIKISTRGGDTTKDIPEKGAIIQRDKETFAIAPHIAGGIIDPAGLRKIADVAEKYNAKVLKITSAQRIAIVGIRPEDIDKKHGRTWV